MSENEGATASGGAPQDSIILEEEIDPNYIPTEEEIIEYAKWLGMDLEKDKDLFYIAKEGLKAPLPENWKPCKTTDTDESAFLWTNSVFAAVHVVLALTQLTCACTRARARR